MTVKLAADKVAVAEEQAMFVSGAFSINANDALPATGILPESFQTALENWTDGLEDVQSATQEQEAVYAKRRRLRLGLGFLVAVLIACVGVRTLGALVVFPPPASEMVKTAPRALFDWLDILLTAGLLAGGSNGIGQLIDAIGRPKPSQQSRAGPSLHPLKRYRR